MDIDEFILQAIINNNLLSLEYDIQQELEHQILTEASASRSLSQKESLRDLFNNARAYLKLDGSSLSVDLTFLSVPKGMEEYADIIKSNSYIRIQTILTDKLANVLTLDESQEIIRNYVQDWAIENLRNAIGGIS